MQPARFRGPAFLDNTIKYYGFFLMAQREQWQEPRC